MTSIDFREIGSRVCAMQEKCVVGAAECGASVASRLTGQLSEIYRRTTHLVIAFDVP